MLENFVLWLGGELVSAGSSLLDATKRVSVFYLLSALLFAALMMFWRYGSKGVKRLKPYLSWQVWWHPSARTDYQLWLANRLLLAVLIPKTLTQAVWISWLYFYWQEQGFTSLGLHWPTSIVIGLFTLCYFLVDDFSRFLVHWAMHKSPTLWSFHQVHHSAKVLTPFTVFRTHPVEGLLFFLRSMAAQSLVVSVFLVAFPNQVSLWQVFGVLVTTFIFNVLGANLRHSGVALSYGPRIEKWLISPAQHQVHHSVAREHYDRNFGVTLAIWDRLFGSWHKGHDDQVIRYGTGQNIDEMGLLGQWLQPFKDCFARVLCILKKLIPTGQKNAQPSKTAKGVPKWENVST
ncbi:sterol desaturase family protein [Marinomonas ostreistagni]|uniref:sterol desaturase family protein n=1 Tax=Marinomonas ostreistagni TaxID=359209 RepID=UPI00194EA81B|nr:sterol desaturase family protein [Marinomonas ostreistagni]MBM6552043.1 sterol desaturase family protein [Marinomonas ostreistagni]